MKASTRLIKWKQSRKGLVISGVIELILAYLIGSRALDTGSWWQYLFAFIFLVGAIKNLIEAVVHGNKPKNSKA